jgi:hypothetical protein
MKKSKKIVILTGSPRKTWGYLQDKWVGTGHSISRYVLSQKDDILPARQIPAIKIPPN